MKRFSNIWILQFRFFVLILIHIHWLWLLEFYFWWSDIMEYKCNYSMAGGMSWPFKLFFEFKYCALLKSYAQQRSSRFCNWNFSFLFSTPKLSSLYKKLLYSIYLLNLFLIMILQNQLPSRMPNSLLQDTSFKIFKSFSCIQFCSIKKIRFLRSSLVPPSSGMKFLVIFSCRTNCLK